MFSFLLKYRFFKLLNFSEFKYIQFDWEENDFEKNIILKKVRFYYIFRKKKLCLNKYNLKNRDIYQN